MPQSLSNSITLVKKLGGILILYSFCRLLFLIFNFTHFSSGGGFELLSAFFFGLRFDLSVILLSNAPLIIFHLLPFPFRESPYYRKFLSVLFIVVNSAALIANCVDMGYFRFTLKRSTADILNFFNGEIGNDAARLLPLFLLDFWYLVLIGLALIFFVFQLNKLVRGPFSVKWDLKGRTSQILQFIFLLLFAIVGYRGGLQLKPITIVDAATHTTGRFVPLLLNTPFTILKTLDQEAIEASLYFQNEHELLSFYNPYHPPSGKPFKKYNVVLIALESFSKEYIGSINGRSTTYTPFLDSLLGVSRVYTNAFANGKKSIEGIPAITASIPSWMNEPFITSPYAGNQISGLASLLKAEGYQTSFFHGGTKGTMGFDAFAGLAGYENYYGREEYNNDKDYDGSWGIWDEEFFNFTIDKLKEHKRPFLATLFTLTSHHPYVIPAKYSARFQEGTLPIHKSIRYSDYALSRFFEKASQTNWYNNTLFVLCADHTGTSADPFYTNKVGNNAIPLIFFMPSDTSLTGRSDIITQQIDVMPSILDYLGYGKTFFSFGSSVFNKGAIHFASSINNGQYDLIYGDHVLSFNGQYCTELYNFTTDSLLQHNILYKDSALMNVMEKKIKAILQTYQQSLMNNKMH